MTKEEENPAPIFPLALGLWSFRANRVRQAREGRRVRHSAVHGPGSAERPRLRSRGRLVEHRRPRLRHGLRAVSLRPEEGPQGDDQGALVS